MCEPQIALSTYRGHGRLTLALVRVNRHRANGLLRMLKY
jgi:hypothetical protein